MGKTRTAVGELHVACMLALGLAPARECRPGEHVEGHVCRGMQIAMMLAYFADAERDPGLRAHAAPVAARLAVGANPEYKDTVARDVLEAVDARSKEAEEVKQGCVIALGHLADGDGDKLDKEIRASLEKLAKRTDGLTRRFAVMALARASARPGEGPQGSGLEQARKFLLGQLSRGREGMDGWAGLGLAVLEFHALHAGGALSDDVLRSLQHGLVKACLLYTSPSPRDQRGSRMPSSA